ncbi:hypothetical protein K0G04_19605 [Bacteroides fragilis]|nr:hypothetical protein [Bacteroides fragilis]
MKKLDLSMIPIDLKVGEEMEVLTPKGDKVTVRCVEDKRNDVCEHCFFGENSLHICSYVKCSERERETGDSVSYQEVKRERLCTKIQEGKEYKVGDIVRLSGKYKYAKVIESNKCNGCVLMGKGCNVICGERERSDGKSIVLLPCNKKGELL